MSDKEADSRSTMEVVDDGDVCTGQVGKMRAEGEVEELC
jgi:hypothetical protein